MPYIKQFYKEQKYFKVRRRKKLNPFDNVSNYKIQSRIVLEYKRHEGAAQHS